MIDTSGTKICRKCFSITHESLANLWLNGVCDLEPYLSLDMEETLTSSCDFSNPVDSESHWHSANECRRKGNFLSLYCCSLLPDHL